MLVQVHAFVEIECDGDSSSAVNCQFSPSPALCDP